MLLLYIETVIYFAFESQIYDIYIIKHILEVGVTVKLCVYTGTHTLSLHTVYTRMYVRTYLGSRTWHLLAQMIGGPQMCSPWPLIA